MRLMHIADLHLGCRMYGMRQREEDFYDALSKVGDIAIRENVDAVVVSGDMFDTPKPPARAVCEMAGFVDRMRKHGKDVVGIEGNHDVTEDGYWLRVCGIWPLQDNPFENSMNGVRVAGFNHCPTERLLDEMSSFADVCEEHKEEWPVVAVHIGLAEMGCGFNPDASASQLVPALKRIGCKYLALGHIHIPMEQFYDGISFVQPGSLELKSIDEPAGKLVEIVDVDGDGTVRQKQVPYPTRKVANVTIHSDEDIEKLAAEVADLKDSFVVAFVSKGVTDGISRVSAILSSCSSCRVVPVGDEESAARVYSRDKAIDLLKDAVTAYFDEGSDQYNLVMRILSTGEPRPAVEEYLNAEKGNVA